ncbi:MAG TPA: 1-acyl-sn-glycerol-3-phosphate acyltransferase [Candidatus Coprenecus stercorigallinarum]|nr:1-acyl-sn-glycerol-3-phosphate acyltransferase [Candidatus Coprenecus stercorigallinarum]
MQSDNTKITKGVGFQRGVYAFCRTFIGPFVNIILHVSYRPCKVQSRTFLCLGNHTQNLDPALMVIGTRRHMRFVANASLTRGMAGFFLNPLFGIIPREKGAKGDAAIALIEANLRAGVSVGMFPEGNRSWDGETEYISPRTAALVKDTGVALLTYRFTGGYLLRPRWADHKRKGPMRGELVHEYTAEEISRMTVEEIYAAICRDLRVNAYEAQAATGALYRGKALAEGLQYAAYLCPHCLRFGTVETRGNWLSCSCGLTAKYLETGWFEKGNYMPFDNFAEWNRFQKRWVHEHCAELRQQTAGPIVHDDGCFRLTLKKDGVFTTLSDSASVAMYGDRLELSWEGGSASYRIEEITGYGTFLSRSMYFNCGPSLRYQMVATKPVSTLKYYALWRGLSGREYL